LCEHFNDGDFFVDEYFNSIYPGSWVKDTVDVALNNLKDEFVYYAEDITEGAELTKTGRLSRKQKGYKKYARALKEWSSLAREWEDKKGDEEKMLPDFQKGERGPHTPTLTEKWTQPPKPYTEATLLRAMETAGKSVTDEELRDALKENGIGRPSTRAAIIETLFKRNYIRKERKSLIATPTGIDLIGIIHEDLLKSAELTGQWEKKLREIESHQYDPKQYVWELKQLVWQIVQ
jgi:DNA topoisomerase IA